MTGVQTCALPIWLPLWVRIAKFASTPVKGWLVVTMDDANGGAQANQIRIGTIRDTSDFR